MLRSPNAIHWNDFRKSALTIRAPFWLHHTQIRTLTCSVVRVSLNPSDGQSYVSKESQGSVGPPSFSLRILLRGPEKPAVFSSRDKTI